MQKRFLDALRNDERTPALSDQELFLEPPGDTLGIGFWRYLAASWIGMLPGTVLYVYLGFAGISVAQAASGRMENLAGRDWRVILWTVGLLATALLTFQLTRIARRALEPPAT